MLITKTSLVPACHRLGQQVLCEQMSVKLEKEPTTKTIIYSSSVITSEFTGVTYGNMSEGFQQEHGKFTKDRILRKISPSQQLFTACVSSERARLLEPFHPSNRELPVLREGPPAGAFAPSIVEYQWTLSCAGLLQMIPAGES